jgi:hypothetical protein
MVHIYVRPKQSATRQVIDLLGDGKPFVFRLKPRQLVWCSCCKRKRIAKNCYAQVYYDLTRYSCKEGKGCK